MTLSFEKSRHHETGLSEDLMRILIIDDELLIIKTIIIVLTGGGHVVVGKAGDVERGLQLIDEAQFDLAIVDINLDGVSAEPLIRSLVERNIPALLISGYAEKQRPEWARAVRSLSKPFGPNELPDSVAAFQS